MTENFNSEDQVSWVLKTNEEVAPILANVGGLAAPDQMTAFVLNGYETTDGKSFESMPFQAGKMNGSLIIVDKEVGETVYERVSKYVSGKGTIEQCREDENQQMIAKWNLKDEKSAILVLSSENLDIQDALEKQLEYFKIKLHRSIDASFASDFDAAKLLSENYEINSEEIRSFLEEKSVKAPAQQPRPSSFKPR